MEESGAIHVPDPWRLEDVFHQWALLNPTQTSEFLNLSMPSYLKVWQSDGTMPIGLMNRWELLTYHLNTIARSNRSFSDHPKSYWNKKRRLMRNDKDFVIGMNTLGHAMASLFKSFNLIDTSNHEEMYWLTIFKDAVVYHLLTVSYQFHSHL